MRSILLGFVLMLLCVSAWAVNVPFASPPFTFQFKVDQPGNVIDIRYPGITNIYYIPGTTGYISNQAAYFGTNNFSGGGGGTSTNLLPLNNTWTGTNTWSANTNEFSFALHSGSLYVGSGLFSVSTAGNLRANSIVDAGSFSADGGQFFSDGIGNVTAISFSGIGTSLTALNASQLTSGTVAVARLPVATTSTLGILRPDNTTITISGGIITAVGSSSTITNISGGVGISITQAGGTNFVAITGLVVTNAIYTNAGPNFTLNNTLVLNTNGFGGGGGSSATNYVLNFGGSGTNETFWNTFVMTNFASGNGITFDGTSFLLSGINLNTVGAGSIGGNGAGLVHLNGSGIDNGTVSTAFLQANVVTNAAATNAGPPVVIGHTLVVPTNAAAATISATNIFPIVGTNTGPFNLLTLYGTGAVPALDSASIAFDGTNIVATAIGTYAINGTHTNFYFFVPILYGLSNIAPYTQSSIIPTNNGIVYTNLPVRSVLQGAINLTTSVGSAATADIFWTNSGVAHFQEFSFPSGAANTYKISVNGIQLDPLATIRIVQAAGTISATNLWLNNN